MPGSVDLLQVKLLAEASKEYLHQQRLVEIEELVLLVVSRVVRLLVQVLLARHSRSGMYWASLGIHKLGGVDTAR